MTVRIPSTPDRPGRRTGPATTPSTPTEIPA
jgi:hypothetical protein